MRALLLLLLLAASPAQDARGKAEEAFGADGVKTAAELLKKGRPAEARFLATLVASRVGSSRPAAEKVQVDARAWKGKAGKPEEAESRIEAFGKRHAAAWRKLAGGASPDAAARLEAEAAIFDALAHHAAGFVRLAERRAAAGAREVAYDLEIAVGAQRHAAYATAHPDAPFDEDAATPEFSEAGKRAAENGLVAGPTTLVNAVEVHLATFYNRLDVLHPGLERIGFGLGAGFDGVGWTVLDCGTGRGEAPAEAGPVAWPADKADQVYLAMRRQRPEPVPDDAEAGYPITLVFPRDLDRLRDVKATLRAGASEIACHVSTPSSPANAEIADNGGAVGLIPKELLKPATKYRVKVEALWRGAMWEREWGFTTGADALPR